MLRFSFPYRTIAVVLRLSRWLLRRAVSVTLVLSFLAMVAKAATRQWSGTLTTGSWATASDWGGTLPGSADIAAFANISAGTDVTLDGNQSVSQINVTATTGLTVTIDTGSGGTLTAPILNTTNSGTLVINAVLAGTSGLSKTGNGTVVLTNSGDTFTGGVTVSAGTLTAATGTLRNNAIALNGGTLNFDSGATTGTVTINGGTLNWNTGNTQDISGQIVVADGAVTTVSANSQTITLASALQTGSAGTGSVTKSNAGTFVITAANSYTGGTRVNNGTIVLTGGDNRLSINGAISFGNAANFGVLQLGDTNSPSNQTVTGLTVLGTSNKAKNSVVGGNSAVSTLTVNLSAPDTYGGTLGGSATNANNLALTLTGSSTLTLSAVNTYTGGTNINGGTLAYGIANALPSNGAVNLNNGILDLAGFGGSVGVVTLVSGSILNSSATPATLTGASYNVQSGNVSAILGGSNAVLTKSGSGTVTLSGANTYSGGTIINGGMLALGAANAIKSGTPVTVNGGTLDLGGFNDSVGMVTLTGGGIINSGGSASLTGSSYVVQSGTINAVLSGALSPLTKNSDGSVSGGTVTLNAANTYGGLTTINGGNLNVSTTHAGGGGFTLNDGATLGVNLGAAGQTLVTSALTLGATTGGTINFNLGNFGNPTATVISATGALTLNGTTVIDITAAGLNVGEFPLISYTGSVGGTGTLLLGTLPARITASLDTTSTPQEILLNVTGFDVPRWTGAVNGNWDIDDGSGTVGTLNWKLSSNSPTGYYQGGAVGTDSVVFDDTAATNKRTVNLTTTLTPTAVTVNNGSLAGDTYTFAGSGKLGGATTLTKEGSGILILANTGGNDFTGMTTISGGVVQEGDGVTPGAGQLGSGNVALSGGTLAFFRPLGDDFAFSNTLSGNGTIQQEGADTVTVTGNNLSFNGAIVASAGTLKLGSVNGFGTAAIVVQTGATLDVTGYVLSNAFNFTGGAIEATNGTSTALSGAMTLNSGGATIDVVSSSILTISGAVGGSAGLTKIDTGVLILSGVNSYSGATAINAGALQIGSNGALGLINKTVTVAAAGTLDLAGFSIGQGVELDGGTLRSSMGGGGSLSGVLTLGTAGGTVDVASGAALTVGNSVIGSGALAKTSPGTLVLTVTDNYSGGTNLNAGTLEFATPSSIPTTGTINFATGTTLAFGFAFNQSVLDTSVAPSFNAATIALGLDNSNNLDFTNYAAASLGAIGSVTYSGILTPSGPTYYLGGGGGTLTFASQLTGANNLNIGVAGSGTVILTAANTFSGATTITAGTLQLGNVAALGPVTNPLTVNGTLDLNGFNLTVGSLAGAAGVITDNSTTPGTTVFTDNAASGSTTYSGGINNGANGRVLAFVKDGAGSIIFNKVNGSNYTGGTTIHAGTIEVRDNNAQVLPKGSNLLFSGTGTFVAGNNGTGTGSLVLGTLTFGAGEGTVQSNKENTGTTNTLTFAAAPTRSAGATGNFTLVTATDPSLFKVVFTTVPATGQSLDGGIYFGGSDFAAYDATGHYVRTLNYATDSNAVSVSLAADQASLGSVTGKDVQVAGSGNIIDQGTDSVRTLKIAGANNLTLDAAAILTVSAGGILKTGGNAATIGGGVELDTGGEGDLVVRTAAVADVLTIASTISSETAGGITASGLGTLILSGSNSFTGPINIVGGTLEMGSANAFGSSTDGIILQTGTILDVAGFSTTKPIQLNGGTLRSSTGAGSLSGVIALNGNSTFDVGTGATLTIGNTVSGPNALTKSSFGTAVLGGANTFTGSVTVSAGTLRISNNLALGVGPKLVTIASANRPSLALDGSAGNISLDPGIGFVTSSDGTANTGNTLGAFVNVAGNNVINGTISMNNGGGGNTDAYVQSGTLTLAGGITAASSATSSRGLVLDGPGNGTVSGVISNGVQVVTLTKQGTGTWLVTAANTFSGATAISAGDLQVNNIAPIGTNQPLGPGTTPITLGAATTTGTLEYVGNTAANLARPLTVNGVGGGVVENSSGALLTLSGTISANGRPLTLTGGSFNVTGLISGVTANSTLNVNAASVVLSNTNSYNGSTKITGGGLAQNGVTNALPIGSTLTLGEATRNTGGTYDLNGFDQTIAGLNSVGTGSKLVTNSSLSGFNTLTISGPGTFDGAIKDGSTAATALTTVASAAQVLSGANTYSGATTINGGSLIVSGSLNGTTSVAVNAGTLGGNGLITTGANGDVTVASGGGLAPGNSGPGTLTLALGTGKLDLSGAVGGSGWLNFDLGTSSDELSITTGVLNIGSGLQLSDFNFADAGGFGQGTYVLFNTSQPIQGTLGANVSGSVLGFGATLQFANGGDELVLNVVPEPGTGNALFGGLGVLLGFQRLRGRRRSKI